MRQSGYKNIQKQRDIDPIISYSLWAEGLYKEAKNSNPDNPNQIYNYLRIESTDNIEEANISINTGNNLYLKRSANYVIHNNANGFFMPGARVREIKVNAYKNGKELTGFSFDVSMSNTVIMVTVNYTCFGIPLQVNGYSIIT